MASVDLEKVSVEFPVYGGGSRSLKKTLMHFGSRGRIGRDAGDRVFVEALRDVSLSIANGDRVGLIGANGAGKTTLLRVLAGIYEPTRGTVLRTGSIVPLFDPALGMDHEATGYENIFLRGLVLGMTSGEIEDRTDEIAAFTELGEYLDMPVRTYSSGMALRLAFAISTSIEPDILLLDEWIGAGDARFLEKAEQRMKDFVDSARVVVIASHSSVLLERICDKGILLDAGEVEARGSIHEVLTEYEALIARSSLDS